MRRRALIGGGKTFKFQGKQTAAQEIAQKLKSAFLVRRKTHKFVREQPTVEGSRTRSEKSAQDRSKRAPETRENVNPAF